MKDKLNLITWFLGLGIVEDTVDVEIVKEENEYLLAENEALWKALKRAHNQLIRLRSELKL